MGNVLRILKRDFLRLLKAPAAIVVILALLVLPSIYTWYNVLGFWNPYDETGNLNVYVVNEDEGAQTEATGFLNVGDRIVEALMENDQLNWIEADRDTAMDDLSSGEAYAVFVIPGDFSECLVSPLEGDVKAPVLQYYVNEKLGPVSPKITDTGSNTLDQTINSTFVSVVSDVATETITEKALDAEAQIGESESRVSSRVGEVVSSIGEVRQSLQNVQQATQDAKDKSQAARTSLDNASTFISDSAAVMQDVATEADAVRASLATLTGETVPTASDVLSAVSSVSAQASTATSGFTASVGAAQADIQMATSQAQSVADTISGLSADLEAVANALPDDSSVKQDLLDAAAELSAKSSDLQTTINNASLLSESAYNATQAAQGAASDLDAAVQEVSSSAQSYSDTLFGTTVPALLASLTDLSSAAAQLSASISGQQAIVGQARVSIDQLDVVLDDADAAIGQTDTLMAGIQTDLNEVSADVAMISGADAVSELIDSGRLAPESIADFMASPTQLETVELYPLNAYGSAMAPLFMSLTFWIGAFMLMVVLRQEVDGEGIKNITLWQRYLGRFAMFAIYVVLQAVICCAGVLFIGVQAANVPALFLASAVCSLAYLSIIYALSVTLRHIGKGLCIVLVFAQIPGASGIYPIELTSPFFQAIYPFFPFTYGIDATREAIGGFYGNHFASDIGMLVVFFALAMLLGLVLHPLMSNVNRMVARQVHESDLFNGENVVTPARPYRLSQVLHVLSDRADFRENLQQRYERFSQLYPQLIRGSVVVGVAVPVALALVFTLTTTEKVVLLTIFLIWLIALFVFLVVVESQRYSFERQLGLGEISDERLVDLASMRENLIQASTSVTEAVDVDDVVAEILDSEEGEGGEHHA